MTTNTTRLFTSLCVLGLISLDAGLANAQADPDPSQAAAASAQAAAAPDPDAARQLAEPDYRIVNLPTALRLPVHGSNFQLTHRFNGNFGRESFGQAAGNLFGLDEGATIGFEYRYGIARHVQAAVYRSAQEKTFQFYGKYDPVRQDESTPLSVSFLVSVEGANNFRERYSPALGAVVSRTVGNRLALYADPIWVHNTASVLGITRETFFVGLGGRFRILPTAYVVAEVSPRVAGYAPGKPLFGFGIEKRAGGHVFQLNFNNTAATTFGQIARGGFPNSLYMGFNLARKFF